MSFFGYITYRGDTYMFKIGYRTIKTAIGTPMAIYLAQLIGLQSFASAGIITILCIQRTKKKSLRAAGDRFAACLIAMAYSYLFFEWLGYTPPVIGLMLLLFIPTTVALKVSGGIVTSSVIILHLYASNSITMATLFNEFCLVVIGISVAFLVNFYMPSMDREIISYKEKIEDLYRIILKELSEYLVTGNSIWTGKEIIEADNAIKKAVFYAAVDLENHITGSEDSYYHYFKLRERQLGILKRILPLAGKMDLSEHEGSREMGEFIGHLSDNVHHRNTTEEHIKQLEDLLDELKKKDIPANFDEFERRAALFQLGKELKDYLIIKSTVKPLPYTRVRRG